MIQVMKKYHFDLVIGDESRPLSLLVLLLLYSIGLLAKVWAFIRAEILLLRESPAFDRILYI